MKVSPKIGNKVGLDYTERPVSRHPEARGTIQKVGTWAGKVYEPWPKITVAVMRS